MVGTSACVGRQNNTWVASVFGLWNTYFSGNYTTLAASLLGLGEFSWSLWVTGFLTGSDSNIDWMFLALIHWWLPGAEMAFQNTCVHLGSLCLCTSLLQGLHFAQSLYKHTKLRSKRPVTQMDFENTKQYVRRCTLRIPVDLLRLWGAWLYFSTLNSHSCSWCPGTSAWARCSAWVYFSGAYVSVSRD